jgi:hypothetical protein
MMTRKRTRFATLKGIFLLLGGLAAAATHTACAVGGDQTDLRPSQPIDDKRSIELAPPDFCQCTVTSAGDSGKRILVVKETNILGINRRLTFLGNYNIDLALYVYDLNRHQWVGRHGRVNVPPWCKQGPVSTPIVSFSAVGVIDIEPGKSVESKFDLSQCFDLNSPGRYAVFVGDSRYNTCVASVIFAI